MLIRKKESSILTTPCKFCHPVPSKIVRVGSLKLGTGCGNTEKSFLHMLPAGFLSKFGHKFDLGWVISRNNISLLFYCRKMALILSLYPLHLPVFRIINLDNLKIKEDGICRAGSIPPFPYSLFLRSFCNSMPAAGFIRATLEKCTKSKVYALSEQA